LRSYIKITDGMFLTTVFMQDPNKKKIKIISREVHWRQDRHQVQIVHN
jgi:hypothetical protein